MLRKIRASWWAPVVAFVAVALTSAVLLVGLNPPVPPKVRDAEGAEFGQGWQPNPAAVKRVSAELQYKSFADTPAYRENRALADEDVYLWQAATKVLGHVLPARNQGQVGSCVSFGTASAVEHLLLVQLARNPGAGEFKPLVQEAVYALARVEIGGEHGSYQDGAVGAWAAKAVRDYGILPREVVAGVDLTAYDPKRCRDWGAKGLTPELEAECRKSPVKQFTQVKTTAELRAALKNGYPVAICSGQGFASTRDAQGFAAAKGSWAHCMCCLGFRSDRPGFFIWNSWGPDWIHGPLGPGEPPLGGFWAEERVVARMLAQGDSWAFSDARGFPAREIDWFVRRPFAPSWRGPLASLLMCKETSYAFSEN
jgi:hypothetical protein